MKFPVQQSHMPVIVINHQKLIGWSSRILHTSLKDRLYKDKDINGNSPTGSDDFSGRSFERCKNTFKGCNVQYTKFEDLAGLLTAEIMHLGLGMY